MAADRGSLDLANPQNGSLRLPKLCNSVIHHFAFEVRSADAETIEIAHLYDADGNALVIAGRTARLRGRGHG